METQLLLLLSSRWRWFLTLFHCNGSRSEMADLMHFSLIKLNADFFYFFIKNSKCFHPQIHVKFYLNQEKGFLKASWQVKLNKVLLWVFVYLNSWKAAWKLWQSLRWKWNLLALKNVGNSSEPLLFSHRDGQTDSLDLNLAGPDWSRFNVWI